MIDEKVIGALRLKHSSVHPILFQRSVEHATSAGDLFDILEDIPSEYPICWNDVLRVWARCDDVTMKGNFSEVMK
jgi:hypothetical protein